MIAQNVTYLKENKIISINTKLCDMIEFYPMKIEKEYYSDNTRISNSSLGWFLESPQYFYNRLNGIEEGEDLKVFKKGTMVHMFLLQPEDFWYNYTILDFEIPKSEQQRDFAIKYIQADAPTVKLKAIEAFKAVYSTSGKSEDKIASESLKRALELKRYIKYLRKKETKTVISWSQYQELLTIKENVKNHKLANYLLFPQIAKRIEHSEFHINWNHPTYGLDCKSLLDRLIIDVDNKTIILADVKTTASIKDFEDSIEKFDYVRQLSWYWMAIWAYIKKYTNIELDTGWKFETYIVAIQPSNGRVKVIEIDPKDLNDKVPYINKIVSEIFWHKQNNLWEYTRKYYEGNGCEDLKMVA